MSGFSDPLVGGLDKLIRKAIQSPNFVAGVSGWSINKDGTAEFNELVITIQSTGVALLIYNGAAGFGNLIGSWAAQAGTDQYGNAYPAGVGASQGDLSGVSLEAATLTQCVLDQCTTSGTTMNSPNITGGTITETTITFDSQGGALFAYTTTTTTVTQTGAGTYTFTVPTGVNLIDVAQTGAGAGGNGGTTSKGGHGGGGGELAREKSYPVTPGSVLNYTNGTGGAGNSTGNGDGDDGGDSFFDVSNGGVFAHGGKGDGTGGTGSTNSIHENGGAGGGTPSSTGGSGGGGSGGTTGAGGAGTTGSSSTGANGGAAGSGSDSAAGGKGGNNAADGTAGSAPGGGGGGAGSGSSSTTFNKTYTATDTYSYEGSDGGNPNQQINHNGRAYQGGDSADTFNGKAKTWIVFDYAKIASDLAGVTLSSSKLTLNNNHSWFNSGMTVCVGWDTKSSFGSTASDPSGSNIDKWEFHVNEGATITTGLSGLGTAFKSGGARNLVLFKNSNNLTYYGYFAGAGQTGPPSMTFQGTTGGSPQTAGAGADGQTVITYTTASVLTIAIGPVAGTDPYGNSFKAGISATDMYVGPSLDKPLRYVSAVYPSGRFSNSRSGTTTKSPDDYLVLAVEANATYEIECILIYTGGSTGATNFRWNWTGPSGAEWEVNQWYFNSSNAFTYEYHDDSSSDAIAFTNGTANGNQKPIVIKGTLYTGASAGSFSLVWALGTVSGGTTSRLWSGSRLTLRKVA